MSTALTVPKAAPRIGLIVTGESTIQDFTVFIKTLELWHPTAILYVASDSTPKIIHKTKLTIQIRTMLDDYSGKSRKEMEGIPGKIYKTLWTDFMYEKAAVLEWMASDVGSSDEMLWFLDADIVHAGPLPTVPEGKTVVLSPHRIRESDEARYGHYNGGFLGIRANKCQEVLAVWRFAGTNTETTGRFYEQSALEAVAEYAKDTLYELPSSVNFGWWRMYQSSMSSAEIQKRFRFNRTATGIGLLYEDKPIQSFHTHISDKSDMIAAMFNWWLNELTKKFESHKPCSSWRRAVGWS